MGLLVLLVAKLGNGLQCFMDGRSLPAPCPASSKQSLCGIRKDREGQISQFCDTGDVGCEEVNQEIRCLCSGTACNRDLAAAGATSAGSSENFASIFKSGSTKVGVGRCRPPLRRQCLCSRRLDYPHNA